MPEEEWHTTDLPVSALNVLAFNMSGCPPADACAVCRDTASPAYCGCAHPAIAICPELPAWGRSWDIAVLPAALTLDLVAVASVRRIAIQLPAGALLDQRPSTFHLTCADDADGPWRNASALANRSADGTVTIDEPTALNVTFDAECDARFWRLELMQTYGTMQLQIAASITAVRLFGVFTPSPPPPPTSPPPPPPTPHGPHIDRVAYIPDHTAMEVERQLCIARELRNVSRTAAAHRSVLSDLAVQPACEWSAEEATIAEGTVDSLATLRADLLRTAPAANRPTLHEASQLAIRLLPTKSYGPHFDHWFERSLLRAALDEAPDMSMHGTWAAWARAGCALGDGGDQTDPRFGMRVYQSSLEGLDPDFYSLRDFYYHRENSKIYEACFHYTNRPVLLGRIRPIVRCDLLVSGSLLGEVHVPDATCGVCRGATTSCNGYTEATAASSVTSVMAIDDFPAELRTTALGSVGQGLTGDFGLSGRLRGELRFGWPLAGFERCLGEECRAEQESLILQWTEETLIPLLSQIEGESAPVQTDGVRFSSHFPPYVGVKTTAEIVGADLALAALPLPLGFIYLLLYTNSVFLAFIAALQTAVSWPCALFAYRYLLGFNHLEELTLLASPLTAPFSLEAVTLLVDMWRMSTLQPAHIVQDLSSRLNWVMRNAGFACANSIFVGIAGFIACSTSQWLPIAHFGAFCALVLTAQLLLALLLLPVGLVLYHDWLETKPNLVFACCLPGPVTGHKHVSAWDALSSLWRPQAQTSTEHCRDSRAIEATLGTKPDPQMALGTRSWPIPGFLGALILPHLKNGRRRRALLLLSCGILVPIGFGVAGARPALQRRGRLVEHHDLLETEKAIERAFDVSSSEATVRTTLLWGTEGIDTYGVDELGHAWGVSLVRNSSFRGRLAWSPAFRFDEATQLHIASACEEMRQQPWVQLQAEDSMQGGAGRVHCFIDDFRDWLSNRSAYTMSSIAQTSLATNGNGIDSIGTSFPVPSSVSDLALSAFVGSSAGALWQPYIGSTGVDSPIRFVAVAADMRLRASATRLEARDSAEYVANLTASINARAPASAGMVVASAGGLWSWMTAQYVLPYEAVYGALRTLLACLFTLLLITQSPPLVILVAIPVGCATLTELALLVASGWALGSTESVLACITPALLTPPAALIVRAYTRASRGGGKPDRVSRAVKAFERASAPIVSNWLSIGVAMCPMLACQLQAEFKVAAALCFVAVCVGGWICIVLPFLLAELGPSSPRAGMPLWGSLGYCLLPLVPVKDRVPIEDEPPLTYKWYTARRRKRRALERAKIAEEAAAAAAHRRKSANAPTVHVIDGVAEAEKERKNVRLRSLDLFEQANAALEQRQTAACTNQASFKGGGNNPALASALRGNGRGAPAKIVPTTVYKACSATPAGSDIPPAAVTRGPTSPRCRTKTGSQYGSAYSPNKYSPDKLSGAVDHLKGVDHLGGRAIDHLAA